MLDVITPQRFYQYINTETQDSYGNKNTLVNQTIDLKTIVEIKLVENETYKQIILFKQFTEPTRISLNPTQVGIEEYNKFVTAWTTYKLITEK